MYLVAIKLIEILARAAFVAGTTYSLGLAAAGQFGLVVTLIGLFALGFGWERHIDLQRRMVGEPEPLFDRAVAAAMPFWGFNYAVMLPVFIVITALVAKLKAVQLVAGVTIVISEHLANQVYQLSLVNRRYRVLVTLVLLKNLGILAITAPAMLFFPSQLTLDFVLTTWAAVSLISTVGIALGWYRLARPAPHETPFSLSDRIWYQHRASLTHFRIGIVAYLILQYDRLAVGTFAGLTDAGIYFRHVLLVFFGYQLYTVASFNRITPAIFHAAKTATIAQLVDRLRREYLALLALAIGGALAAIALDRALGSAISRKYHLDASLAAILLAGTMVRIAADLAGLIVNARRREAALGRAQLLSFACGAILLAGLTWQFGIVGAAIANVATSAVYLILMVRIVRGLPTTFEA